MRRTYIGWLFAGLAASQGLMAACSSGGSSGPGAQASSSAGTGPGTSSSGAGGTTATGSTTSSGVGAGTTSSSSGGTGGTPVVGDSVLMHHKNPNRDGVYVEPALTKAAVAGLKKDPTFNVILPDPDDHVYAQPLFLDGGAGGEDLLIVATGANNIYALDGATGAVAWKTNLGEPVALSLMKCGNIDPFGVTGTPVIDFASRTLFVVALIVPAGASTPSTKIFALSIDTGAIKTGWPIDVATQVKAGATTFNVTTHGERGALAVVNGTLYVPFGGLYGDCNPYHGWVTSIPLADPSKIESWATTLNGGGVWAPGGISSDGTNIYIGTGNTFGGNTTWGGGEGAVSFAAASPLAMNGFFAPKNWLQLDNSDSDLGATPIPFDLAGSTPGKLLVTFGKDGGVYLLDRTNLGGVGAAIGAQNCGANTPCYSLSVASNELITAPTLYTTTTATYVAFKGNGSHCTGGTSGQLTTVKMVPGTPPSVAASWCANAGNGSPIVTTSDGTHDVIVWTTGAESDHLLHAFDGDTGAVIPFAGSTTTIANMERYNTLIAAKGRLFVPADGTVVAFTL